MSLDWIDRAGAKPKGARPKYFEDPAIDRLLSIVMALAGEVAVVKERLDTVERLLDAQGSITRADIEAYAPDRTAGHERGLMHREFAARILRGVQQDMESLQTAEKSMEDVSKQLRDG
ncbi:hypothetical protein GCM10007973_19130 [Polymorphobacter multimanifer]|nr:hypothetical protein [Polymorphobacter multimanifer]GGI82834.1 hypothetical protein GCM10007973_19130 [Polymorphobacter multimanifer]